MATSGPMLASMVVGWSWSSIRAHLRSPCGRPMPRDSVSRPTPRDYNMKVATANGMTRAALVELGMVEIGNIVVRNIPALVHPDQALGVNLLGMSFLSRVRWTHERGKLILEQ